MPTVRGLFHRDNLPILLIPLALLIWAHFGAADLGRSSFNSVVNLASPYIVPASPGPAADPITSRVVLVVVDGLRVDASRQMPTLNRLAAEGAQRRIQVGQPSLSLPGWTVLGTGAWQEQSGVTTNWYEGSVKVDTIFEAAKRKGLTTALVGGSSWAQLYPTGLDWVRTLEDPADAERNYASIEKNGGEMTGLALEALAQKANLTLIHLPATDFAGHGWGGISKQYADAAQLVDSEIAQLVAAVDLAHTTFIVTADHGHTDTGGHAGWEPSVLYVPFVAAGQGIKPGQYPDAFQVDVVPSLAVLLGTSIPAHNQGQAMLDILAAPQPLLATRAVQNATQIADRYDGMLQVIGDRRQVDRQTIDKARAALVSQDYATAMDLALRSIQETRARWESAKQDRLNSERLARLPLALLLLLPFVLYLVWWKVARWDWQIPVVSAVVYFLLWSLNYFVVKGLNYSLSAFNSESQVLDYISARVTEAMVALVVAMLVVGVLSARASLRQTLLRSANALFVIAAVFAIQILAFFVLWGIRFSWSLPDLFWGFKYYMDVFQTTAFYPLPFLPLAAFLPLLAALAAWTTRTAMRLLTRQPRVTSAPA